MIVNRISQHLVRAPEPRRTVAAPSAKAPVSSFAGALGSALKSVTPVAATSSPLAPKTAAATPTAATVIQPTTTTPLTGTSTTPPSTQPGGGSGSTSPDTQHPTAEDVFGANPWLTNPGGVSATGSFGYNPQYFATPETAQKVAQLLGGTVVQQNAMVGNGGPFSQTAPNQMVQLANGHLVNAGLTASYYTHGWSQTQINQMLQYDMNV
jgi:hypothetical protein